MYNYIHKNTVNVYCIYVYIYIYGIFTHFAVPSAVGPRNRGMIGWHPVAGPSADAKMHP